MSSLNIIRLLPPELQNQIAAGEVVERPSSVVKELVENSLDAGATQIEVRLDQGGMAYIGVRDNGHGIAADELELAVTRHATSKLQSFADLLRIASLGFRGEALPSIASVSRLRLTSAHAPSLLINNNQQTKRAGEVAEITEMGGVEETGETGETGEIGQLGQLGELEDLEAFARNAKKEVTAEHSQTAKTPHCAAFIAVEHGIVTASGPAALERGTFVEVNELFNNVPARLKFLKTQATELKRCQELLSRLALAWLDVGFTLNSGGKEILNFPPRQTLAQRIALLWPPSLTSELKPFDLSWENMRAHGLAGSPAMAQTRADRMLFYVNGRSVQDRMLLSAAREAYKGRLLGREYPQLIIFLELPPEEVDVNVHPAKTEVRFVDENLVFRMVRRAVNQAVSSFDILARHDAQSQNNVQASYNSQSEFGPPGFGHYGPAQSGSAQSGATSSTRPLGFWGEADRENIISPQPKFPYGPSLGVNSNSSETSYPYAKQANSNSNGLLDTPEDPYSTAVCNNLPNNFTQASAHPLAETLPETSPEAFANSLSPTLLESAQISFTPRTPGPASSNAFARPAYLMDSTASAQANHYEQNSQNNQHDHNNRANPAAPPFLSATNYANPSQASDFVYLGQIAQCYLLVKEQDSLLLLDQHAVHEAILHSRLRNGSYQGQTQLLGLPINLSLHPSEVDELEKLLPQLEALGYVLEFEQDELNAPAQTKTLQIKGIPAILEVGQGKDFLHKSLNGQVSSLHDMWASMACRAAIKANCPLTNDEALELVRQWINTKDARYCPHGRPTGIRLGVNELEKMFKRKP